MAKMVYGGHGGSGVNFLMPNDLMISVQRVIADKFAAGEGFWFEHNGNAVWLHPSISVAIFYDEDEPIRFSRENTFGLHDRAGGPLGLSTGETSVATRVEVIDPEWEAPASDEDSEDS